MPSLVHPFLITAQAQAGYGLQGGTPNDHLLFCGDLGNEVNDDVLSKAFTRFPSFNMARIVRDKRTGKTKGYGFVSFSNPSDLAAALKEMNEPVSKEDEASKKERVAQMTDVNGNVDQGHEEQLNLKIWLCYCLGVLGGGGGGGTIELVLALLLRDCSES
ncbi:polyadenylate-binding protein RBP45C-like [Olea europaea var. sylvestris]|uniref:polyadenylate-binding protein RBP45C-like n=1 Tax=Olea europaea var. sylvestris TaxID=158386 RepID=UPI000C1D6B0D|nr:polyadenylate-binding protein RBP45C-like [Olea europaea var. sylvestris]